MHYKYMFLVGSKSTCNYICQEDIPNNEKWTRCKYPNIQSGTTRRCSR